MGRMVQSNAGMSNAEAKPLIVLGNSAVDPLITDQPAGPPRGVSARRGGGRGHHPGRRVDAPKLGGGCPGFGAAARGHVRAGVLYRCLGSFARKLAPTLRVWGT
jgi:hypothetical protein